MPLNQPRKITHFTRLSRLVTLEALHIYNHIGLNEISHLALYVRHQNYTSGSAKRTTYKRNPLPNSQAYYHPPYPPETKGLLPLISFKGAAYLLSLELAYTSLCLPHFSLESETVKIHPTRVVY